MSSWTPADLTAVAAAEELRISSTRPDGSDRPFITIWVVRAGDDLFVRSAYGTDNPWYRRAVASGAGRIRAGGVNSPVTLTPVASDDIVVQAAVDAAYHAKYDRYGPRIVGSVTGANAHPTTLRLDPR